MRMRVGMMTPRHGVNEQDARALAYLAGRLRTETDGACEWDAPGIWAEVKALLGRNLAITAEQVLRHAGDPTAKTPGAIRRPFTPDLPAAGPWRPPKRDQECRDHAGEHVDSCRMCAADRLAGDGKPSRRPAERIRVDTDAARAALRRAER